MELRLKSYLTSGDVTVVEAIGQTNVYNASELRELLIDLVNHNHYLLVIDLSKLDFLDSTGLGVIVGALKRVRAHDGRQYLVVNKKSHPMKILRITGLTRVFRIFDDVSTAVAAIRTPPSQNQRKPKLPAYDGEFGSHWFPARIYTSQSDAGKVVEKCLRDVVDAFGMEVVYEFPVLHGSWFREFILRMKDSTALPSRDEQLNLLRRALEMQVLDRPQAQIDITQSQAVANLVIAFEKTPSAIVQVGSVLLIKNHDVTIVRNLTQLELAYWERNPGLFHDPEAALRELQRASDSVIPEGPSPAHS